MTKTVLEAYVHHVARRLLDATADRFDNANDFDHRERLAALHTLDGYTGPLERLCQRFNLRPLSTLLENANEG